MANEDITALIEAGEVKEALLAIGAARREGRLSGSEARALGKLADAARPAPPVFTAGKKR